MERETRTITTPAGKELILKARATTRERNAIRSIFIKNAKFDGAAQTEGEMKITEIAGTATDEVEAKALELFVVSYDGKTSGISNLLLDSDAPEASEEYDFIISEATKTLKGSFQTAK